MQAIFAKIIAFFMSILAFFGLVKPTADPTVPGAERFEGEYIMDVTDEKIEFRLDANRTTGYEWVCLIEGSAVEKTDGHYEVYEHEAGMTGVGGIQFITLTAVKPGKATVTLDYSRDWEEGTVHTLVFEITVADDMSVSVAEVK